MKVTRRWCHRPGCWLIVVTIVRVLPILLAPIVNHCCVKDVLQTNKLCMCQKKKSVGVVVLLMPTAAVNALVMDLELS